MLNVYLLRHGQTSWNADGNRYCGRTDISLTEEGKRQAEIVRTQLVGVKLDAVYSSPLQRAYLTAEIAGGGKKVMTDARLIEVDFGKWEGKTKEELMQEDPNLWKAWDHDPANSRAGGIGEIGSQVVQRVEEFFNEVLQKHAGGSIIVVGHNGINRLYLAHKLEMPLRHYRRIVQENSSVTLFSLDDHGEISLKRLNTMVNIK